MGPEGGALKRAVHQVLEGHVLKEQSPQQEILPQVTVSFPPCAPRGPPCATSGPCSGPGAIWCWAGAWRPASSWWGREVLRTAPGGEILWEAPQETGFTVEKLEKVPQAAEILLDNRSDCTRVFFFWWPREETETRTWRSQQHAGQGSNHHSATSFTSLSM